MQKILIVKGDFRKCNVYGLPKSCADLSAELKTCRFFLILLSNKSLEQLARQFTLCLGICASRKKRPPSYLELELHSSWDEPLVII